MLKNIVFDFDGVIVNSHDVSVKALTKSFKTIVGEGQPPYDEFFRMSGDSLKNVFEKLNLPLSMIPVFREVTYECIGLIKTFDGMAELLQALNENGCNCALCTGKERARTLQTLRHLGLEHLFKVIVCSDDVANPKPHPESLFAIINNLHASKENTIMIGDGINDILAARGAGIDVISVTWGDIPRQMLVETNPTYLVDSVLELKNLLFEKLSKN